MKTRLSLCGMAAVILLAGCGNEAPPPPAPEPKVSGATVTFPEGHVGAKLGTVAVEPEAVPPVQLNGRLAWDEERTARVFSPFTGRVAAIRAQVGDQVRAGQVLATLTSPEFGQAQAEARRAETDLGLAKSNLQRQRELEAHGVTPRKELQTAEAEYARSEAEVQRARGRVRAYGSAGSGIDQSFAISSPIAGLVVEKNINPGQEVRPDQVTANAPPLFVVTDPRRLWVLLDASERDIAHIRPGKPVRVESPAWPGTEFVGRIASVADFVDPATRAIKVRATIDNPDRKLKAEMFVNGRVAPDQGTALQVPAKAIYFQEGKHYVFVQEGPGRFTRREVQRGDEHRGRVRIDSGVERGDVVVTEGVLMLQQMLQPRRVQK